MIWTIFPDLDEVDILLPYLKAKVLIADKGYDAQQRVVEPLLDSGKQVVIPNLRNRKHRREYDKVLYRKRHLIENFFACLKQYRALATRYDKTATAFFEQPPKVGHPNQLLGGIFNDQIHRRI